MIKHSQDYIQDMTEGVHKKLSVADIHTETSLFVVVLYQQKEDPLSLIEYHRKFVKSYFSKRNLEKQHQNQA